MNILKKTVKIADEQLDLWTCAETALKIVDVCTDNLEDRNLEDRNLEDSAVISSPLTSSPITHLYALPFVLSAISNPTTPSLLSSSPPAWWKLAACSGYQASRVMPIPPDDDQPTDIFFPERGEKEAVQAAKRVCATCPVRLPCLIDGLREAYGVFGGFTVIEREEIRRKVKSASLVLTFAPPHRDQPGWCIDCGIEDDFGGECMEPGSRRHDPFFIFDRPRREQEERIAAAREKMRRENEMEEVW